MWVPKIRAQNQYDFCGHARVHPENYQHELTQKTVLLVPPGSYYHTPRYPTNRSSATTTLPASMGHHRRTVHVTHAASQNIFFTRRTEDTLTDRSLPLALYSSMPSLVTATGPFYLNFTNDYPMLPLTRLANPLLMSKENLYLQQRPSHQPKWKRSRRRQTKLAHCAREFPQGMPNLSCRWEL